MQKGRNVFRILEFNVAMQRSLKGKDNVKGEVKILLEFPVKEVINMSTDVLNHFQFSESLGDKNKCSMFIRRNVYSSEKIWRKTFWIGVTERSI